MKATRINIIKQILDYIPFILLAAYTTDQWLTYYTNGVQIPLRTYIGMPLLIINSFFFTRHHQLGVLFTAFVCILGFIGAIILSPSIITTTFGSFPIRFGDLRFIGIFILNFIISFRFYLGIVTPEYWRNLAQSLKLKHV